MKYHPLHASRFLNRLNAHLLRVCVGIGMACSVGSSSALGQVSEVDRIQFTFLEVQQKDGVPVITLGDTLVRTGRLRNFPQPRLEDAWLYIFRDQAGNALDSVWKDNPLEFEVEYTTDSGSWAQQTVQQDTARVMLRTAFHSEARSIEVQWSPDGLAYRKLTALSFSPNQPNK